MRDERIKNKLFLILIVVLLISISFLLSSCYEEEYEETIIEHKYVCGDGFCDELEKNSCNYDCALNDVTQPKIITPDDIREQLKEKQQEYTPQIPEKIEPNNIVEQDTLIVSESFTDYLPSKGFRVANKYNLLELDEEIEDFYITLTKYHLPVILRSGSISSNTPEFGGRRGFYEQYLRLKAGKVVFGFDENEEIISDYLDYKDEEAIIEYVIQISGGIFKFFEGSVIHFLGHDYVIEQVTPSLINLVGVNTPDTIMLRNNSGAIINGEQILNNVINVTLKENLIIIVVNSESDMNLFPGENLMSKLKRPITMLTNRLDVEYLGLTEAPTFNIFFDKMGSDEIKLFIKTNKDREYKIPLLSLDPFRTGDDDYSFIFQEGESKEDYNIKEKDYFLIGNGYEYNGLTNVIKLVNVKETDNIIIFEDPSLEEFVVYFSGTPGEDASADLIIDNKVHKVYIGPDSDISVDLDGNGRIQEDKVPIVTAGNGIIKINEMTNEEMNLSYTVPGEQREETNDDLIINFIVDSEGIEIDSKDLEMLELEQTGQDDSISMTQYGSMFLLKRVNDNNVQKGEELIIQHPAHQRFADVMVKGYE